MDTRTLSRYAFFVFLLLLPFQTVFLLREPFVGGEKWQYGTIGIYLTDVFMMSALALVFYGWLKKHRVSGIKYLVSGIAYGENTKYEIRNTALILLVLWAGISILWAPDQILAGYFFVKLLLGAGAFFFVRSLDDADVRTAIRILLVAAILQVAIATGQFLRQTSPASTLLGMSTHDAWQAGTSVLKNESGRWLRAYGSFPHPNMLGGFLAATLVLTIGFFHPSFPRRGRGEVLEFTHQNPSSILPLERGGGSLIGDLLILLGLILTFSRTAWLGAAIGIAASYVIGYVTGRLRGPMAYRPLWVLGVTVAVFVFVLRDQVFPRFDTAIIEREGSVSERALSLRDAESLIVEHPFLGVGAGNFTATVMADDPHRPVWSVQPAHDVFALILAELGIVGLVLFSFFVGSVLHRARQKENAILAIAFLSIVPSLFLDHWLWTSHFGIFLLFLLAGLATRGKH